MADWSQTVVQILATPLITAGVSYSVASAVVRRQSLGEAQVKARNELREVTAQTIFEVDTYLHKRQFANYDDIVDVYVRGFLECSRILEVSRYLSKIDRIKARRYCARMYGRGTVRVAEYYPRESTDFDSWADDMIQYEIVSGENRIKTTYQKGELIQSIFGGDTRPMHPRESDRNVQKDLQGRGFINVFHLAGSKWAKYGLLTPKSKSRDTYPRTPARYMT
ncbi:hypothetical protein [Amycolatopsis pithecellobii]|uniref:DUF4760 domain-containing protein n=1 Tax=Amycolatopsis pithecellobii TaxID=664692 RepID=A0A6N7YLR4_9PSEU|nr:hypothetical protein [Amycolatopsis pithecellobii]MTD53867.1 hypothetical protein [Amycolatopsis pithecellobii]